MPSIAKSEKVKGKSGALGMVISCAQTVPKLPHKVGTTSAVKHRAAYKKVVAVYKAGGFTALNTPATASQAAGLTQLLQRYLQIAVCGYTHYAQGLLIPLRVN